MTGPGWKSGNKLGGLADGGVWRGGRGARLTLFPKHLLQYPGLMPGHVCVCFHVCMCLYDSMSNICICACVCVCICVCPCACVYGWYIHLHVSVCIHVYLCVHMCPLYLCVYVSVCVSGERGELGQHQGPEALFSAAATPLPGEGMFRKSSCSRLPSVLGCHIQLHFSLSQTCFFQSLTKRPWW